MYSAKLLDHFEHPRHAGTLADATHTATVENLACGDVMELSLRVEGERIVEVAFKAKGCVPAMACASAVTDWLRGKSVNAARSLTREDLLAEVGSVPPASGHALDLAMDAVKAALKH